MAESIFFCGKKRDLVNWGGTQRIQTIPFYTIPDGSVACENLLESRGIVLGAKSMIVKFRTVPTINGYYFFEEYASKYVYAFKADLLDTFITIVLDGQRENEEFLSHIANI